MRVFATAIPEEGAQAIGRVEFECTPAGLSVSLYRVASYSEGYAPGPVTSGSRVTIPYSGVHMQIKGDQVHLRLSAPGFPYNEMIVSRFAAGPGVPPHELRQRRLILHFAAIGLAGVLAIGVTALLARREQPSIALPLTFGIFTALSVLGLGFSLDQRFFLRPPDENRTRETFVQDLSQHLPQQNKVPRESPKPAEFDWIQKLSGWLPTRVGVLGATLAGAILTLLVTGKVLLNDPYGARTNQSQPSSSLAVQAEPRDHELSSRAAPLPPPVAPPPTEPSPAPTHERTGQLRQERTCLCDRADSPLWSEPLPRLSGLLLDSRILPRTTHNRLEVEVAAINNGDEPLKDITIHVAFFDSKTPQGKAEKERPLYFEGPLRPGAAVKWTTEARGNSFKILVPDLGKLGQNGEGAASKEAFRELLSARNRPVRLHAARVLGYLGDNSAREAALKLKDAYRAREAPYLRRVLTASAELRVCDTTIDRSSSPARVSACVYNGSRGEQSGLGLWVQELNHPLDPSQPLANPPSLLAEAKWPISGSLAANSGAIVTTSLSAEFTADKGRTVELILDTEGALE